MVQKSEYRKTLGTFTTGVTIITTVVNGEKYGFTANSFTSVSLEPPLVLFCVKKEATFVEALSKAEVFGINILSDQQEALSNRFANPALVNDERFDGIQLTDNPNGCPKIEGCIAFLDCTQYQVTEAGDHLIVMGQVESFERMNHGKPLLYFGGGYRTLS